MAFGSDRSANFVIAAKDAATKPMGNIGKAMGKLKSVGVTAFKALAAGVAIAAAAAISTVPAATATPTTMGPNQVLSSTGSGRSAAT